MKAVQIIGDKTSPKIVFSDSVAKPVPRDAEILVAVYAAGVTGDEVMWPEVYNTTTRIPGHDISGVIAELGCDYRGSLTVGQEVWAFLGAERGQGQAEFTRCSADEVAPKPESISHIEAAALPIPLLTAWEVIADHCVAKPGMRVLLTGASGAVGLIFVQLAKLLPSAYVIALASPQNHQALKQLGASEVLDYNTPGWERLVTDIDLVFDTVGGDVLTKTWKSVGEKGVIVTVADPPPPWAFGKNPAAESGDRPDVKYKYFVVSPNGERLAEASRMIDDGSIKALAIRPFLLQEAEQAWASARQRNRGYKVVIDFKAMEKA